ncbi:hypothetical protein FLL45_14700 [Aliikangiella marina]|uniref:Uncharacterized protein n=1 Tax=Aliikangiella marina TaxID=1712262 RepID=A0A545TA65_9GAMM|nr:hypothetical protein [Aliikangiella marina]TQV74103.1 hypothetical protein FLL45_14700 [Aliikangiella marina]
MRDPERIDEILDLIGRIWKKYPDLRFQQLIYICQSEYSEMHKGLGKVESEEKDGFKRVGFDLFNLEDDQFLKYLKFSLKHGTWSKDA